MHVFVMSQAFRQSAFASLPGCAVEVNNLNRLATLPPTISSRLPTKTVLLEFGIEYLHELMKLEYSFIYFDFLRRIVARVSTTLVTSLTIIYKKVTFSVIQDKI